VSPHDHHERPKDYHHPHLPLIEFDQLAAMLPELEWFAAIRTPNTPQAPMKTMSLLFAASRAFIPAAAGLRTITRAHVSAWRTVLEGRGLEAARDLLSRTVACLEGESLREHFGLPVPASIYSRTWLVASLAELDAFAEGIARNEEEVRIAASVDQLYSVVQASFSTGFLYLRKGDLHKAIAGLERGLELCRVWNFWS
jgi:hypothetical protein